MPLFLKAHIYISLFKVSLSKCPSSRCFSSRCLISKCPSSRCIFSGCPSLEVSFFKVFLLDIYVPLTNVHIRDVSLLFVSHQDVPWPNVFLYGVRLSLTVPLPEFLFLMFLSFFCYMSLLQMSLFRCSTFGCFFF